MKKYTPENAVFTSEVDIVERADLVNAQIHNTSIKQLIGNEVALKNQLESCIGNMEGDKLQFADGIKSEDVVNAINEVFLLGSEKKAQLAANLTAMGIQVSASDTWDVLLDKILDMTDTSNDTVTAPALLEGYTAHDATGGQIEGEMPEMAAVTVDAVSTTQDNDYTYLGLPGGHYDENSKVRTKNSNIWGGKYVITRAVNFAPYNAPANSGVDIYVDLPSIDGYTPILATCSSTGLMDVACGGCRIEGNRVKMRIYNHGGTVTNQINAQATVLYVKF